jgi:hypothetical protein
MNIHPDFEELLRLLEEREIEYMIVGGYAVAYHGHLGKQRQDAAVGEGEMDWVLEVRVAMPRRG